MSPRASRLVALSVTMLLGPPIAQAQTIADYSRAQRALLESTMSQAAARSAGFGAPAPIAVASVPAPAESTPRPMLPPASAPAPAPAPGIQVSGVFASSAASVAEIVVNAMPYLLRSGQGVPGTAWRVEAVAVDRVVLSWHGRVATADADGVVKVFALPALR
jgi:hypothetical protein